AGVPGEPATLLQAVEPRGPARQQFVDVGLVAGVPDDRVRRALEHSMDGEGELDHTEVGREVATRPGDLFDEEGSDLPCQLLELGSVEPAEVRGGMDGLEHCVVKRAYQPRGYCGCGQPGQRFPVAMLEFRGSRRLGK